MKLSSGRPKGPPTQETEEDGQSVAGATKPPDGEVRARPGSVVGYVFPDHVWPARDRCREVEERQEQGALMIEATGHWSLCFRSWEAGR